MLIIRAQELFVKYVGYIYSEKEFACNIHHAYTPEY